MEKIRELKATAIKRERERLTEVVEKGIPSVYKTPDDYWADFWAGFSWSSTDRNDEIIAILADSEWHMLAKIAKARTGYDFVKEVASFTERRTIRDLLTALYQIENDLGNEVVADNLLYLEDKMEQYSLRELAQEFREIFFDGPVIGYVNAYVVTREYGGPEEGGWWYNRFHCIESVKATEEESEDVVKRLLEKHADEEEGDIYSVLGGTKLEVHFEDRKAKLQTRGRPHYE